MASSVKSKNPSLFQSHGIWYFKITVNNPKFLYDPNEPKTKRLTFSTRTANFKEAEKIRDSFIENDRRIKAAAKISNLSHILLLFMKPETNPKMLSARIEGKSYSIKHAENVARDCKHLYDVLDSKMSHILYCKITEISRLDSIEVRQAIFDAYGNSYVGHEAFKKYKMALTYAADLGIIPFSPADKIDNIKPKDAKPIFVLSAEDILAIYSAPELFSNEEARAQFFVFATTGMRRSELGALTVEQVYKYKKAERIGGRLVFCEGWAISIDRAYKDNAWETVGSPKWNKTRCIPIADVTYKVLEPFLKGKTLSDRVFNTMTKHTLVDDFETLRNNCHELGVADALSCPAAIDCLSPHKLRHALNTILSTSDIKDILTNEYMSWSKQKKDNVQRMQSHYTHINVSHLSSIASLIQDIYGIESEENMLLFQLKA